MSVITCKGSFMQHRTFTFSFYPKFKTQLLYTECVSAEIPYTWKHNSGFFTSYASTSQPLVAFLNLYETERTSDSVGKILWPRHLNVYHTRANPKYSRISLAMFKLLNMWAKAKDDNLKLQDKIPNFEQKNINHLKRKVHKVFGVIFAVSFGCSKPGCLSSTRQFSHFSSVTTTLIVFYFQYQRYILTAYTGYTGKTFSLPSLWEQKSSLMWRVHIHLVPAVKSCIKFNLSHFSFTRALLKLWLFIAL